MQYMEQRFLTYYATMLRCKSKENVAGIARALKKDRI